ncbi:MAG: 50S ribosomal protein L22 [Patescibacteria group bacterium]
MKIIATQKNVRQTPRKLRLVANQVKDLSLELALKQLAAMERRATIALLKTIRQAIANAQHNHGLGFEDLKIDSIMIGEAAKYKRFRAASRGRAHSVVKRSSHIRVVLESQKPSSASSDTKALKDKKATKGKVKLQKTKKSVGSKVESKDVARKVAAEKVSGKDVAMQRLNRASSKKSVGRAVKATRQRTTNK